MDDNPSPSRWRRGWPWTLLALIAGMAAWYYFDFEDDVDPEFPKVVRPTFGHRPSPAYRLAEPGDTLDRVGIYLTAGAIVVSAFSWLGAVRSGRPRRPWLGALAVSLAAFWFAANPGPTFDGWHGLGWRALWDSTTPAALRIALGCAALAVVAVAVWAWRGQDLWARLCERHATGLVVGTVVLVVLSRFDIPGMEPVGFWPRWVWVGAMTLWAVTLCRVAPRPKRRVMILAAGAAAWFGLVVLGIDLTWYHRPLERLRTVVPGRIYLSAMPSYRGLQIANARHHFKTIINLFPESRLGKSPRLAGELKFARENGIQYIESPAEVAKADEFLDDTLRIAQDPSAWPILVHCHASMDRSPAWVGIYRFVVQGRPLREIFCEIEGHRGYRPKASVILLYNRVLPPRAPDHYAADPDAALLRQCTVGTHDPYYDNLSKELAPSRPAEAKREDPPSQISKR